MERIIGDFEIMLPILIEDVNSCLEYRLGDDRNQLLKRNYVRTVFALIEATTHKFKQAALEAYEEGRVSFSTAEVATLKEESYELNDTGGTSIQQKFIPITKNLRFAFKSYAHFIESNYVLKVDDEGWNSLRIAIEIRNRLMHPKSAADLEISDKHIANVEKAYEWYKRVTLELLQSRGSAIDRTE